jgi:iron complex outermembrane receptor protein
LIGRHSVYWNGILKSGLPMKHRHAGAQAPRVVGFAHLALAVLSSPLAAQSTPGTATYDPIVVTATRDAQRAFDVPASADVIDGAIIRGGQPAINLSESLVRVPGVFAANRQNYAQDLQISSRGFGARAQFGVRGVRLYQDDIPVTMPDGQGQTGSFSLLSAGRIEVLRGPFSTLYGNASGGVISVYTENGTPEPVVSFSASAGSYDTVNLGIKATGIYDGVGYVGAYSWLDTNGYRDHSAARRRIANAKITFNVGESTRVTVIGSQQYQPHTQDPLGLNQAQWMADPTQADPVTTLFNTNKTISQYQGGLVIDHALSSDTSVRLTGFGGRRMIEQFLALTGVAPTSSGGVVDLDRDYGGFGARLLWKGSAAGRPLTLNIGADVARQKEHRQGFVNNFGVVGDLRRDEDDTVTGIDAYAEAQWYLMDKLSLTLGVRTSRVHYSSDDRYVTPANPDDSGSRTYYNTSPIAGVLWSAADNLNVYFSFGQGFETPTFAELAYNPNGAGLNLNLLPATATAYELGLKWLPQPTQRVNLAVFTAKTKDEIVVNSATGGRTTYANAGKTRRRGVEAEWDAALPGGFTVHANYTYLLAEFADPYTSAGTPPVIVPAGSRLPGVPPQQFYGVLNWAPGGYLGFNASGEVQYVGKIYANDRNTAAAPAYTIGNVQAGFAQSAGRVKFTEYVRLNNITDKKYVGSVIVGDTNARYFEPAPGRNWFVGATVGVTL